MRYTGLVFSAALGCAAILVGPVAAQAQEGDEPAFAAENPGFLNAMAAAPVGRVVADLSVGMRRESETTTITLPALLARVGVVEGVELRTALPSAVVSLADAQPMERSGVDVRADGVSVGVLVGGSLSENLSLSLSPIVAFPIDDRDGVGPQGVETSLQGNLAWKVADALEFGVGALGGVVQPRSADGLSVRARFLGGALLSVTTSTTTSIYGQGYVDCVVQEQCVPSFGVGGAYWAADAVELYAAFDLTFSDGDRIPTFTLGAAVGLW